jgi:hypothetical protein
LQALTVAKLRAARESKRREAGSAKGGRLSLRAIAAEFAARGFLNEHGRPFCSCFR